MKITTPEFKRGYNAIVEQEKNAAMNMDFGVLSLSKGDCAECDADKERIYVLGGGTVTFRFGGQSQACTRNSRFHEDPIVLHVPARTPVHITCMSSEAELTVHRTTNSRTFEPKLLKSEDLLCASEQRGAGTMNEASTRIVRTFFDRSNCPETNFFIGEVVSFPGKWSSYPPHSHVEPEIYFYKFLPENGYGFAEMGDDAYKVRQNDMTLMANGVTHSQATAPGYAEYYLWVIRLQDNEDMVTNVVPEHAWAGEPGAKYFPEI